MKDIPRMSKGLSLLIKSLKARRPVPSRLQSEPLWDDAFNRSDVKTPTTLTRTLLDLGYSQSDINRHELHIDNLGYVGPIRPFSDECIQILSTIAQRLEEKAPSNPHIVSRRLRGAQHHSKFIADLIDSPDFLYSMSELAGVPLILHPHPDAAVQINYYRHDASRPEKNPDVAKWHTDGMDYVLTVLLTDSSTYTGGNFLYYDGVAATFDPRVEHHHEKVRVADFHKLGESIFTKGSKIFHGVTPVTQGFRVTLVISLFCPYFHMNDSNRFWHSAPDDGLVRTVKNWTRFKLPWHNHRYFFQLSKTNEKIYQRTRSMK